MHEQKPKIGKTNTLEEEKRVCVYVCGVGGNLISQISTLVIKL